MRYIDESLVDLDQPEPTAAPRPLSPRYLDADDPIPIRSRVEAYMDTLNAATTKAKKVGPWTMFGSTTTAPRHYTVDTQRFSDLLTDASRSMTYVFDNFSAAFAPLFDALRGVDVIPEPGPTDPRERALWLRQNRNTGPSRDIVHQRRPRST